MRPGAASFDWRSSGAQATIVVISTIVVALWVYNKPIVFSDESFAYIDFARELQQGRSSTQNFLRLPVFPAILRAFHITDLSHSVSGLIFFHSCLAVASCWLFYLTARLLQPRGAFILSLVFIASLLPFLQVKHIMTEQTFLFETMLTLYGLVAYLVARTRREALISITILGMGTALMMLTRPQGAYVVPVLFGLVAVLAWRRMLVAFLSAVLVVGVVWAVHVIEKRALASSELSRPSSESWRRTGKVALFVFYLEDGSKPTTERLSLEKASRVYFDPWLLAVPLHPKFDPEVFSPPLSDEIAAAGDYSGATNTDRAIDENLRWLMRAAIVVALVTLPIAFRYSNWRVMVALLFFGLYLNFPAPLGNSPLFRHAIYAIPVNLLCAYVGMVALVRALGERYLKKPAIAGI
jgi:4-amino-4-deoxy-L-arabinose transferase-like glycosyltransferase